LGVAHCRSTNTDVELDITAFRNVRKYFKIEKNWHNIRLDFQQHRCDNLRLRKLHFVATTRNMFSVKLRDMYSKNCELDKKLRHRLMSWGKQDWAWSHKTTLLELPIFKIWRFVDRASCINFYQITNLMHWSSWLFDRNYQYLLVWMFGYAFKYNIFWYSQFHRLRTTTVRPHSKCAPRITKSLDCLKVTDRNVSNRDWPYFKRGSFELDRRRQDLYIKRNFIGQTVSCGFLWCKAVERQLKEVDLKFISLKGLSIEMGLHNVCTP
jgi:hypothetical protein